MYPPLEGYLRMRIIKEVVEVSFRMYPPLEGDLGGRTLMN
jgi:hypothetical protein